MHTKINASKGKHVKVGRFIPRIDRIIDIQEHDKNFIGSGISTVCKEGRLGKVILITNCPVKAIIASGKIKSDFFPRLTILGKTKAGKVVYETTRCEPINSINDLEPESALLYHEMRGAYKFSDVCDRKYIPYQVQQDFITIKKELNKLGYEEPRFDTHEANLMRLGDKIVLTDPIHEGHCSSRKPMQKFKLDKHDRRKGKRKTRIMMKRLRLPYDNAMLNLLKEIVESEGLTIEQFIKNYNDTPKALSRDVLAHIEKYEEFAVEQAFTWRDTPEGYNAWHTVCVKYRRAIINMKNGGSGTC